MNLPQRRSAVNGTFLLSPRQPLLSPRQPCASTRPIHSAPDSPPASRTTTTPAIETLATRCTPCEGSTRPLALPDPSPGDAPPAKVPRDLTLCQTPRQEMHPLRRFHETSRSTRPLATTSPSVVHPTPYLRKVVVRSQEHPCAGTQPTHSAPDSPPPWPYHYHASHRNPRHVERP